jgi:hypothetical protein
LKADRRLAKKLQQEYNQQTTEQNRPLPEIQITEPFEKAGEQQEQVQAEGTEPETSTSGITASIESVTEEMEVIATSDNIKKTTKRSRTLPQKSTKEFSDYERNNKKKQRGQLSESSMEEEESDNDEDILSQSPENQGPVTQLAEGPSNTMANLSPTCQGVEEPIDNTQRVNFASADSEQTYDVMVNALNQEKGPFIPTNESQAASTAMPPVEKLQTSSIATIPTPWLDSSIVDTVNLIKSMKHNEQSCMGITQVEGTRPETNHAGKPKVRIAHTPRHTPSEKSTTGRQERVKTSAPSFDRRGTQTAGSGPPKTA